MEKKLIFFALWVVLPFLSYSQCKKTFLCNNFIIENKDNNNKNVNFKAFLLRRGDTIEIKKGKQFLIFKDDELGFKINGLVQVFQGAKKIIRKKNFSFCLAFFDQQTDIGIEYLFSKRERVLLARKNLHGKTILSIVEIY